MHPIRRISTAACLGFWSDVGCGSRLGARLAGIGALTSSKRGRERLGAVAAGHRSASLGAPGLGARQTGDMLVGASSGSTQLGCQIAAFALPGGRVPDAQSIGASMSVPVGRGARGAERGRRRGIPMRGTNCNCGPEDGGGPWIDCRVHGRWKGIHSRTLF